MPPGRAPDTAAAAARRLGWIAYAALAAGLVLYVLAIWAEVYVDTRAAARLDVDRVAASHRHWRLRTSLLFLIWTIAGGLALPFGFGVPVLLGALIWYLWRLARGLACHANGTALGPLAAGNAAAPRERRRLGRA